MNNRRNDNYILTGKTIVITGASSGAGKATALEFARYKTCLVLAARNKEALEETAGECREFGAKVIVVPTDVTDPKAVINLANQANDWHGKIDIWVNNAGVLAAGNFEITPLEVHEQVIKTNLMGYINCAHALIPFFKKQQKGILINNISIAGYIPVPYGVGYSASKFGLRGFGESLRSEMAAYPEIYICDMFPAFLDTPGMQHAANYTGVSLKPAPPVYDPVRLAKAIVEVAKEPQLKTFVGSESILLKASHALLPEFTARFTGWFMRRYFHNAKPIQSTSGNLFNTVDYGMSTYGGWGIPGEPMPYKKYIALGLIGVLAGTLTVLYTENKRSI